MLVTGFCPTIENDRVLLRQWKAADFEFYAGYLGNEATARYIGGAIDQQKAWRHLASAIGHWTLRGFGVYAVEESATGQVKGCTGLWQPHGWPCREFVFWFTGDAYDSGCALQAARLAADQVKAAFPSEPVTGFIHHQNQPALALAGELGGELQGMEELFDFGLHVRVSYRKVMINDQGDASLSSAFIEERSD